MKNKKFRYEVKKISEDTYLVNEFFSTMFILCGEKRALVIDCGVGVGNFKGLIEKITPLPYDVAVTHTHVDHIGGRGQFKDIYVSAADAEFIPEVNYLQREGFIFVNSFLGNKFSRLALLPKVYEPTVHLIDESTEFDLGGRHIKVISTPGHTVGSVSFLDVEQRTIYIGDVANEFLFMFLPHCTTIDEMNNTIRKLIALDSYDTVWSSHHTSPNTREDIEKYLEGAKEVASGKNLCFPPIKIHDYMGAKLIYRPHHIH